MQSPYAGTARPPLLNDKPLRALVRVLQTVVVAVVLAASTPSLAQAYPDKPIRLVVPFTPGGSNDVISRALAEAMRQKLGQTVVVDNKGGGGGTIGTDLVAKSPPNGYTLLFVSSSLTTNAAIKKSLPYDPVKDFDPVALIGAGPFVVVVSNKTPVKTFAEFLAYARANPGKLNYGSAGNGGINHLGTELLSTAAQIQMTHVPYKGIGLAFTDIMSGELQMVLPSLPSVISQLKGGTMRGLAVTGSKRSSLAPELPTVAESGVPGFRLEVWWGVVAPAGLPKPIQVKLNETINEILRSPEMRETLAREGAEPMPGTPAEFGELIKTEIVRWSKLISDARIAKE